MDSRPLEHESPPKTVTAYGSSNLNESIEDSFEKDYLSKEQIFIAQNLSRKVCNFNADRDALDALDAVVGDDVMRRRHDVVAVRRGLVDGAVAILGEVVGASLGATDADQNFDESIRLVPEMCRRPDDRKIKEF